MQEALWFVRPDDYAAAADDLLSLRSLDCSSRAPGQLKDSASRRSYPWTAFPRAIRSFGRRLAGGAASSGRTFRPVLSYCGPQ